MESLGYQQGQTLYARTIPQKTQQDLIRKLAKLPGVSVLTSPQVLVYENETGTISISRDKNQILSFDVCVKAEDDGMLMATISYSQKAVIDFEESADIMPQNQQIKSEDKITTSVKLKSGQGVILPVAQVAKSYRFFIFSVSRKMVDPFKDASLKPNFKTNAQIRTDEPENKLASLDETTKLAQIKNMMVTLGGTFEAAHLAFSQMPGNPSDSAAKIMEEALPQFEKFESDVKGTNYSGSVHLIIEQIRQIIKANKDGDAARARALIDASSNSWYKLTEIVNNDYRNMLNVKSLEDAQKKKSELQKPAGQSKQEETKKSEFEQLLHKPVTLDISKSPDGDRLTVQYAAIAVCEVAGVPYQWEKSAKLAEPGRSKYIEPVHIKDKLVSEAINDILKPLSLSYGLDANGLYLYYSDLQKPAGQGE